MTTIYGFQGPENVELFINAKSLYLFKSWLSIAISLSTLLIF